MAFFCRGSNLWVSGGCTTDPTELPTPNPPTYYPVFDPLANQWISSGNYGDNNPLTYPAFCRSSNSWITSSKCP